MVYVVVEVVIVMFDFDKEMVEQVLFLIVVVCMVIGGLRVVVFIDVIQFWLLFGGVILIILFIMSKIGFECFFMEWLDYWDEQKVFLFSFYEWVVVVGMIFGVVLWWVVIVGFDQMVVQCFMVIGVLFFFD